MYPSRIAILAAAFAGPEQLRMAGLVAQRRDVVPPGTVLANGNTSLADTTQGRSPITGEKLDVLDHGNSDHSAMIGFWTKVADIVEGAERMREQHNIYLPMFPNEAAPAYEYRWKNAKFTNVYRDIVENLASKPFEQEVSLVDGVNKENKQVVIPQQFLDFVEDVDGSGNTLSTFAADTFFNGVNSTIDWIFIDYSNAPAGNRTLAEEKRLGIRPFWSHIAAANVLEVRSRIINGKEQLTYFRTQEFEPEGKQVRIIENDGVVTWWHLYREQLSGTGTHRFALIDSGIITLPVIPAVPFITGRRKGRSWRFLPMLRDAADLQIELFQDESGLKNIKSLSGFPMLVAEGVKPETTGAGNSKTIAPIQTGPQTVLYAPPTGQGSTSGSWKFIQPDASVLQYLSNDVKETINQLRELGRNPLTAQASGVTVINSAVAAKKTNSAVQLWALSLKNALENALVITGMWFNISRDQYDPEVFVFTDFDVFGSLEDLKTLLEARKNGDISRETLWHEMQRRGMLSGEFDADREIEKLLEDTVNTLEDQNTDPLTGLPREPTPGIVPPVA